MYLQTHNYNTGAGKETTLQGKQIQNSAGTQREREMLHTETASANSLVSLLFFLSLSKVLLLASFVVGIDPCLYISASKETRDFIFKMKDSNSKT